MHLSNILQLGNISRVSQNIRHWIIQDAEQLELNQWLLHLTRMLHLTWMFHLTQMFHLTWMFHLTQNVPLYLNVRESINSMITRAGYL